MSRQAVPLTLTPPAALGGNVTTQSPVNNLLYSGKMDYHITQNHLLTARYAVDRLRDANVIVQTGTNITPDGLTSSTINNASLNVGLVRHSRPPSPMKRGSYSTASLPRLLTPPALRASSTLTWGTPPRARISAALRVDCRSVISTLIT